MARASIETLLPIATWGKLMGINPYELDQIGKGFPKDNTAQCEHVFFQYSWQQNFLSREEVAKCIRMAEERIAEELGYYPAPKYITGEAMPYPQLYNREMRGNGYNSRGKLKAVELNWKKVLGGGILARSDIDLTAAVTLSDTDGDGVNDTFTVTAPTTITDPNQIGVYFKDIDRNSEPIDETWRIRPVRITIASGIVTIKGHCALLVVPDLTLRTNAAVLDVTDAATYVTEVEVHRVYTDDLTITSSQGSAIWEVACDTPPCNVELSALCIGPRQPENGFVWVDYNPEGCNCSGEPDRVSINYLAGEPLVNGQMSQTMANIVAHLTTALLPVEKCGCERADRIIAYWRAISPASGEGLRPSLTGDLSANPFGPQRGAVFAWQEVMRLRKLV